LTGNRHQKENRENGSMSGGEWHISSFFQHFAA